MGKGKGFGKDGWGNPKGFGKDGYKGYAYNKGFGKEAHKGYKGFGKDGHKGYGKDGYKGFGKDNWYGWYGKGQDGKGGQAMQRACFGCGATDHMLRDCPKNQNKVQQVQKEEGPEILFIGNVRDDWKHVPMKVKVPRRVGRRRPQVALRNGFRILEVDEEEDEEAKVFAVSAEVEENPFRPQTYQGHCVARGGAESAGTVEEVQETMGEEIAFVRAVEKDAGMMTLGKGDIIVDSAADESCWPVGQGDAYPTLKSQRDLRLRTANGGEMKHYGEKHVTFKYRGGEAKDPVGLKFQVTDVKKPLLAVRRLVENGNTVVLSNVEGESYITNKEAKVRIPIAKKGGSFVIEANFVRGFIGRA